MSRVMVAMSGGVDSSVAAALLKEAGHDVVGVTLKLWGGPSDSGCCSVSDVEDARRVAAQLDVPHYVLNLTDDFERGVVDPYVDAYAHGRTPNPCVECNRVVKFGALSERAVALGCDLLATGHHARVVDTPSGPRIARGADPAKDQSYVLYMLDGGALGRVVLPVGEIDKRAVRDHARGLGLRTADKPESMDVCFVTRGNRAAFVAARSSAVAGPIVDTNGEAVGTHDGLASFTIGQRRGLGVAAGERRYVVDVDARTATVTIGRRDELLRDQVRLRDAVVHVPVARVHAQVRAHGTPVRATFDGETVRFDEPQPRVAPGQVVALYDGEIVVAGGVAT